MVLLLECETYPTENLEMALKKLVVKSYTEVVRDAVIV